MDDAVSHLPLPTYPPHPHPSNTLNTLDVPIMLSMGMASSSSPPPPSKDAIVLVWFCWVVVCCSPSWDAAAWEKKERSVPLSSPCLALPYATTLCPWRWRWMGECMGWGGVGFGWVAVSSRRGLSSGCVSGEHGHAQAAPPPLAGARRPPPPRASGTGLARVWTGERGARAVRGVGGGGRKGATFLRRCIENKQPLSGSSTFQGPPRRGQGGPGGAARPPLLDIVPPPGAGGVGGVGGGGDGNGWLWPPPPLLPRARWRCPPTRYHSTRRRPTHSLCSSNLPMPTGIVPLFRKRRGSPRKGQREKREDIKG